MVIYRGSLLSVFTNRGHDSRPTIIYTHVHDLSPGQMLVDLLSQDESQPDRVMVGHGGSVRIEITQGMPRVSRKTVQPT